MSEYIITDKQLKTATEAYLEHELSRPITDVFVSGDKLPEIVRCRDCKFKDEPWNCAAPYCVEPDGFCAWGRTKDK